jgi:predicted porin
MTRKLIALGLLSGCVMTAHAQSSVTLYGIVDSTLRYATNSNANGDHQFSEGDGAVTGSRFGLRAVEDLGGHMRAVAMLENGFSPQNGTANQSGRLFGRFSYVGLESDYGKIYLGRQYTIAHVAIASWDAFQLANNAILSFEGGNITALRNDNMAKYVASYAGFTVSAQYAFGGVAGAFGENSAKGVSVMYDHANWQAGAFYQVSSDVSSVYYGAVSAANASKQSVWGLGGTYLFSTVKLYGHYENSSLDVANYKNQTFSLGANWQINPQWALIGSTYLDKLKHPGPNGDGTRFTGGVVLDYFLSKTTDVYSEVDYTKLSGGWVQLANNSALGSAQFFGNNNRLGIDLGLRHRF